jgi:hypothetical protein
MKDFLLILLWAGVLTLGSNAWAQEQPQLIPDNLTAPTFCTPYPTFSNQVGDIPEENV